MADKAGEFFVSRKRRSESQAQLPWLWIWPIAGEYKSRRSRRTERRRCNRTSSRIGRGEPGIGRGWLEERVCLARRRDKERRPAPQRLWARQCHEGAPHGGHA